MRRFSITDKLIIASLVLSIITIIIVASYSFTNTKDAILERTFHQLTSKTFANYKKAAWATPLK